MLQLQQQGNTVTVLWKGVCHGTVELYENPYHAQNQYLKWNLCPLDHEFSAELFEELHQIAGRPLQVMVDSDNRELCDFLMAGGFQCRRKCFEVEAAAEDYIGPKPQAALEYTRIGNADYVRCCELMYERYCETHKEVNPWTAGQEAFLAELPAEVFYLQREGNIIALAFVERNEIAYITAAEDGELERFAVSLTAKLLKEYGSLFFESDDCDWAAMRLRAMFAHQSDTSFDTYIYSTSG